MSEIRGLLKAGSSQMYGSYRASGETMKALGFPEALPEDWKARALGTMGELLRSRALRSFLDSCVHCGACVDSCQYFLGTGDPLNMPVARQDLFRKVYKRYFSFFGRIFGGWVGAQELNEKVLEQWYTYFYQCSECRRCAVFCPFGIDTAEITMAARATLNSIGIGQKYTLNVIHKVETVGNNLGIPVKALCDTVSFLENELLEDTGHMIRIPLDESRADVLFVTPSADLYSEPHVFSLMGYAKVFYKAGISWTLSSYASEFANFGLFVGSDVHLRRVAERIFTVARELGVRRIVVGECGHAWRVACQYWNALGLGTVGLVEAPMHMCELSLRLYQEGAVRFDKEANSGLVVTMHDSCNVARGSTMGSKRDGQCDIPRALIRACAPHLVEMHATVIREKTFCCGGGGGLLTDELLELRIKGASPRVTALKSLIESHGVNYMAMICAICKAQFTQVLPHYGLPREMVGGIHQLLHKAIVL